MSDVFISHSSKDNKITKTIIDELNKVGIETWVDFINIKPADNWNKKIEDAIRKTTCALVILSDNSLESDMCYKEWLLLSKRLGNHERLFVALVSSISNEDLPLIFIDIQYADLNSFVEKKQRLELDNLIAAILEKCCKKLIVEVSAENIEQLLAAISAKYSIPIEELYEMKNKENTRLVLPEEIAEKLIKDVEAKNEISSGINIHAARIVPRKDLARIKRRVKQVEIRLVRSLIGNNEKQRRTVEALGLRKLQSSRIVNLTPQVEGMIDKVSHLLDVQEVKV